MTVGKTYQALRYCGRHYRHHGCPAPTFEECEGHPVTASDVEFPADLLRCIAQKR